MKLKKLELHGFKSFSEPTSFIFQSGIICIVGPNGCGKSNIVDAVRWCMGEQSARHLRGEGMEDVIFNGSIQRRPLGMAEVSLTFSVESKNELASQYAGFNELMIARRIFRSGESEYFINKVPCRLKDITDIFLDSGVGNRSYGIIEQGEVDHIISARPEERRIIIEEAAGIRKYKERKREALRRMEVTHTNLQRINDILVELERNINSLRRQAKKAERFKNLKEEIKKIDIAISWLKHSSLSLAFKEQEEATRTLESRDKTLSDEIAAAESNIAAIRDALREEDSSLARIRDENFRFQTAVQEKERAITLLMAKEQGLKEEIGRLRRDIEGVEASREEVSGDLGEKEKTLMEHVEKLSHIEEELVEKEEHQKRMGEKKEECANFIETEKKSIVECISAQYRCKNSLFYSEKDLEKYTKKLDSLRSRSTEIGRELDSLKSNLKETEGRISEIMIKKEANKKERTEITLMRTESEIFLADKGDEIDSLSRSISEEKEKLPVNGNGLMEKLASHGRNGVIAYVEEIFETEQQYRPALEAVLGERLMHLIVKSPADAVQVVEFLKQETAGRGTFIPMEIAASEDISASDMTAVGHEKPVSLISLVKVKEEYQGIAKHLLRGTYLVNSMRDAMNLWTKTRTFNNHPLIFVTMDGDFIDQHGIVTGGSWLDVGSGGLSAVHRKIRAMSERTACLNKEREELKKKLIELNVRYDDIEEEIHKIDTSLIEEQKNLADLRAKNGQLCREKDLLDAEETTIVEDIERVNKEISDAQKMRESLKEEERIKEASINKAQEEAVGINSDMEQHRAAIEDLRMMVTINKERVESLRNNIEELKKKSKPLEGKRQELQIGLSEKEGELASCSQEKAVLDQEKTASISSLKEADESRVEHEKLSRERNESLLKLEALQREKREERDKLQTSSRDSALKLQEAKLTLLHLEEGIRDKYQTDLASVTADILNDLPSEEEREQVLDELKKKVEGMGDVNLVALDEYKEVQKRYEEMTAQKDDLSHSMDNLNSIIKKLNESYREKFAEAFNKVNTKFMEVFPKLFQGGRAELKIIGNEDLQECGVEIVAQPPGKRLQSISLLSGGEKALTAVALIFSMFLIKPTPFCLLDEVDASLDDLNVNRFIKMLTELSTTSQFVLITHNKKTMETAQLLYGVTMQEPGVSTLVSVKLN